jgi:hypothetical protein
MRGGSAVTKGQSRRSILALAAALLCPAIAVWAQLPAGTRSRAVHGVVTDGKGRPVRGADVELEDTRTLNIRSFVTHKDGSYHFSDLYSDLDYTLRVRYHGVFGPVRRLSRFDSRKNATIDLHAAEPDER